MFASARPKDLLFLDDLLLTDGIFSRYLKLNGHNGVGVKFLVSRVTNFSSAIF